MNIKEAWGAIEEAAMCLTSGPDCHPTAEARDDFNAAVRAYGAARELKGHDDACDSCRDGSEKRQRQCEKRKHIEKLGAV